MRQKNKVAIALSLYYLFLVAWWVELLVTHSVNLQQNYLYAFSFALIPMAGGIFGLINSKRWGFLSSITGKSTFYIALGLISWSLGQIIFSFYNIFLNVEIPYPSFADVAFIISWPLWGVGIFHLGRVTGAKFAFKSHAGRYMSLALSAVAIVFSYYLLIVVARGGVFDFTDSSAIKIFFDLFYPFADIVVLNLVMVVYGLSFKYLGGKFKFAINTIFLGILCNYFADFSFSYTTTLQTFYSGNWVDLLFTTAMFLLSLGLVLLNPVSSEQNKV